MRHGVAAGMVSVVGIAGSLRAGSHNAALLRALGAFVPEGDALEIASIAAIPLYDYDVEVSAFPPAVTRLKDRIAEADGLLIATPEYNNSIPGVAKNAIDWLTRPPDDAERVFEDLPVGIVGASPGRWGTVLAQNAWLPVLRTLGMRPYFGERLAIPGAAKAFEDDGTLKDGPTHVLAERFVHGFFDFVRRESRRARRTSSH